MAQWCPIESQAKASNVCSSRVLTLRCHGPVLADFHYLHHRYFECNYGEATIPLDKWFGTFRDGQKAGAQLAEEHKVK